jgi:hypothetical protein
MEEAEIGGGGEAADWGKERRRRPIEELGFHPVFIRRHHGQYALRRPREALAATKTGSHNHVALHVMEQAKQQKSEEKITASSGCG